MPALKPKIPKATGSQPVGFDTAAEAAKLLDQLGQKGLSAEYDVPSVQDAQGNPVRGGFALRAPARIDPALVEEAQRTLARAALLHGAAGFVPATAYGVKMGRHAGAPPAGPAWEGVQRLATAPLERAKMDVDQTNAVNDLLNKATLLRSGAKGQDRTTAMGLAKDVGAAQASAAQSAEQKRQFQEGQETTRRGQDLAAGAKAGKRSAEDEKELTRLLGKLKDDLSGVGRGDQRLKVQQQIFDRAGRMRALAELGPDQVRNLDSREIEELAIGLNAMFQGSNVGSQSQVKALVPQSAVGNATKFIEWFKNEPTGLQQQEFVKRMMGTIKREESLAGQKMRTVQGERLPANIMLFRKHPSEAQELLQSYGFEPGSVDLTSGRYTPPKTAPDAGGEARGTDAALRKKYGL